MPDGALKKFQEISALLNSSLDPAEIRRRAIDAATTIMDAEACSLLLIAEESGDLYFEVALGAKGDQVENVCVKMGQGIAGHVAKTGEPLIVNDVQQDPRFWSEVDAKTGFVTRNMVCVPVTARDRLVGVLQALNKKGGGEFGEADLDSFVAMGHQVGIAIENAQLYEEIQRLFEGFVSASVQAIESRDPTTSGHSQRVAILTCGLAIAVNRTDSGPYAALHFTNPELRELRYAAILHDFGKVGVREHILLKARKLYAWNQALLRARFDFIKRTVEADILKRKVEILSTQGASRNDARLNDLDWEFTRRAKELDASYDYLMACNEPNAVPPDGFARLQDIARSTYESFEGPKPYLTADEVEALTVPEGTLTPDERREIQTHVAHTFRYLAKMPWAKSLQRVPAIALRHHENLDGSGYPHAVTGDAIPVQSRIISIADIFDALTAVDRPYRASVSASAALQFLKERAREGLLDSDLLRLFVDAEVYQLTREP